MTSPTTTTPPPGFMHKLVDWADFERFVAQLYESGGAVDVKHDVTLVGKYGDRRQVDVLVTVQHQFHQLKMVIECKRLKERVDRPRIDVLAAAVEDLGAARGAMFTTVGYEQGALKYAQGKNIDIFVVRDLSDEEWGLPGRVLRVDGNCFAYALESIAMPDAQAIAFGPVPQQGLSIQLAVEPDAPVSPEHLLYTTEGETNGESILDVLVEATLRVLHSLAPQIPRLPEGREKRQVAFNFEMRLDFSDWTHRQLRRPQLFIDLNTAAVKVSGVVDQFRIQRDRGDNLDMAVIIEDYITNQRYLATRPGPAAPIAVAVAEARNPDENQDREDVWNNESVLQVFAEPWVQPVRGAVEVTIKVDDVVTMAVGDLMRNRKPRKRQSGAPLR